MGRRRLLLVGFAAFVALLGAASAAPEATTTSIRAAVAERRWPDVVTAVGGLTTPSAENEYWAGFALLELHRPADAWPHLVAAKQAAFTGPTAWTPTDRLLSRAATAINVAPPVRPADAHGDDAVVVRAGPPTKWSAPVLRAVPEFLEVGRRIFGKDVPPLTLHLFAERKSFDEFYAALFGCPVSTSWQDGTGTTNVVVFCEKNAQGRTALAPGAAESIGCVLHEFGHAWFGTYLMTRHKREWLSPSIRRPWLDEGMSDYVASLREPDFLKRRETWLRACAWRIAAPRFEDLVGYDTFYAEKDARVHYWLAALLVAELLGPPETGPEKIRKLLDEIGRTGDVDKSLKAVTGKDPLREFAGVARRFW